MVKNKCKLCGMIRAVKDLVLLEDGNYICFSCWNKFKFSTSGTKSPSQD